MYLTLVLGEDVVFLGERGLHRLRRRRHRRAGVRAGQLHQRRVQHVVHREEDRVERLLAVLHLDQVVDVRDADLRREARIDGAAAGAGAIQLRRGVVGVDDVFRLHAEAFEIGVEERRVDVGVQHARNADAQSSRASPSARRVPSPPSSRRATGIGSATDFDVRGRKTSCAAISTKFGFASLIWSRPALMSFMSFDVFDRALFAGGDDQALLVDRERHLAGLLLRGVRGRPLPSESKIRG